MIGLHLWKSNIFKSIQTREYSLRFGKVPTYYECERGKSNNLVKRRPTVNKVCCSMTNIWQRRKSLASWPAPDRLKIKMIVETDSQGRRHRICYGILEGSSILADFVVSWRGHTTHRGERAWEGSVPPPKTVRFFLKKYTPLRGHLMTKKVKQRTNYFDWPLIDDHWAKITNFKWPNHSFFSDIFADWFSNAKQTFKIFFDRLLLNWPTNML